jgi:hypothetical protein
MSDAARRVHLTSISAKSLPQQSLHMLASRALLDGSEAETIKLPQPSIQGRAAGGVYVPEVGHASQVGVAVAFGDLARSRSRSPACQTPSQRVLVQALVDALAKEFKAHKFTSVLITDESISTTVQVWPYPLAGLNASPHSCCHAHASATWKGDRSLIQVWLTSAC